MSDEDIARGIELSNINDIALKNGINEEYLIPYGKYKAKVDMRLWENLKKNEDGKLILVTSINPTPLGEGKTTVAIGLSDALNYIGKKSVLALREPSLGPVFGIKGGATGGGYAQVAPMDEINLHFTGDIHAITSANNLISAVIDNHIYFGNELKIKRVVWKRCLDLNDRALRKIEIGHSNEKNMKSREDGFDISVASEIMAILCLSKDLSDFERRVGNITIGYNENDVPVTVADLKIQGAITALMKDAINPNVVQTLEHNMAIIHGGPFANIAHGCNSVIATKLALKLGDYVVTEAGFGADLGAEKFVNIKCRKNKLNPYVAVCVATLKAIKYHGGADVKECTKENIVALEKGIKNLLKHVNNIENCYGIKCIVAINKFENDSEKEIEYLKDILSKNNIDVCLTTVWKDGGKGAIELAEMINKVEARNNINYIYNDEDDIITKIRKVAINIYGAEDVEFSEDVISKIKNIEKLGYKELPICIAKTQYSFSDDDKNILCDKKFNIHISDVELKTGAEFIVVKTGKIFTMPGLPKNPTAEKIYVENNVIHGIF